MEQLIIIDRGASNVRTKRALKGVRKSHEFSDRVFVVEGDENKIEKLQRLPGILTPSQLTAVILNTLSIMEKISIDAWRKKAQTEAGDRPGDGLSWGDPNFSAPR